MRFEWDEENNQTSIRKHHISFETAKHVFKDKNRIEIYDEFHSITEYRYITIGEAHAVLFVVYTVRTDNIRIISARVATKYEKEIYYDSKKRIKTR